jgi:hypothetical protein
VDCVEDIRKLWVQLVVRVHVCVAKVLDVFGKVTEEEDVLLTDLAGDLNLYGSQYPLSKYVELDYLRWHHHRFR